MAIASTCRYFRGDFTLLQLGSLAHFTVETFPHASCSDRWINPTAERWKFQVKGKIYALRFIEPFLKITRSRLARAAEVKPSSMFLKACVWKPSTLNISISFNRHPLIKRDPSFCLVFAPGIQAIAPVRGDDKHSGLGRGMTESSLNGKLSGVWQNNLKPMCLDQKTWLRKNTEKKTATSSQAIKN